MKISVAFIVYNGENYMRTQLDSILVQTHKVDEIIVVEDASSDNTIEILNNYSKQNPSLFFIYYNEKNLGSYKSIEKAIKNCTGDIIILADHDDYWEPNKVATIVNYLEQNPTMNGVFTNGFLMDETSKINANYELWDSMCFPYKLIKKPEEIKLYINTVENTATGAAMAIRNNLPFLKQPFPVIKYLIHDRWLAINLAEKNTLGILNEKLIRYRLHPKQETGGRKDEIEKYIEINKNLYIEKINVDSFKELRYILNKIEINLHIQNEIKKIEYKSFNNDNYIYVLKNKHNKYLIFGFKKWPLLSLIRIIKKWIRPVASQ
jgi:glycosyltransferase involved in cell wall biosynthesis